MHETTQTERYQTCLSLYLQHAGCNLLGIEREMRDLGFSDFNRRILYSRTKGDRYFPGWIERYDWRKLLSKLPSLSKEGWPPLWADGVVIPRGAPSRFPTTQASHSTRITNASYQTRHSPADPDFQAWLKRVSPGMTWDAKHQKLIYKHLQRITDGDSKRLMIFMPPRHGKSELVTVRYAAWRLWQDPKMRIILGSYNQNLANNFSRSIRRVLSEEENRMNPNLSEPRAIATGMPSSSSGSPPVSGGVAPASGDGVVNSYLVQTGRMFPPSRTINTAAQWETALGGGVKAVGVGAGVTGFGAQLIVIDDPVKSRAQAESETFRNNLWNWYNNDLYTRLEPDGAIILIQTRWHEDDLAGRLLREMENGGQQWEVINLPALAETARRRETGDENVRSLETGDESHEQEAPVSTLPSPVSSLPSSHSPDPLDRNFGDALWPERYPVTELADIQRQLGSYAFSALYQQRPTPAEGGIFKREWFKRFVDKAPEGLTWKRGYDLAVSTRTAACYTASFRVAFDDDGNLYIADGFRKRIEFPEQKRYIYSRIRLESTTEHGIEQALHGQALMQELRREARLRGVAFKGVTVSTDKLTRALKWSPRAEEGKVILVRGHWNTELIEEAAQFPSAHFDDQIDAISLAVSMFEKKGGKLSSF